MQITAKISPRKGKKEYLSTVFFVKKTECLRMQWKSLLIKVQQEIIT